tara:strand:- start:153 stop:401 length:249 start_codon:yes stop_codon:yes gene_type:complete
MNDWKEKLEALLTGEVNMESFCKIAYVLPELTIGDLYRIRGGAAEVKYNERDLSITVSYDIRQDREVVYGVYRVISMKAAIL